MKCVLSLLVFLALSLTVSAAPLKESDFATVGSLNRTNERIDALDDEVAEIKRTLKKLQAQCAATAPAVQTQSDAQKVADGWEYNKDDGFWYKYPAQQQAIVTQPVYSQPQTFYGQPSFGSCGVGGFSSGGFGGGGCSSGSCGRRGR